MKLDRAVFTKWQKWMKTIECDFQRVVSYQEIFIGFQDMVRHNRDHFFCNKGEVFFRFVVQCYVAQALMGLRRQIKSDRDSISLLRVMREVQKCAAQFSYEFYLRVSPVDSGAGEWQRVTFGKFSDDGRLISHNRVEEQVRELLEKVETAEHLADCTVAHLDKRGCAENLTFEELGEAIGLVEGLVRDYLELITGVTRHPLQWTNIRDWQDIFYVPMALERRPES